MYYYNILRDAFSLWIKASAKCPKCKCNIMYSYVL